MGLLWWIGFLILFSYGFLPLLICLSMKNSAEPQIEPILPYSYPPEIANHFAQVVPVLIQMGYVIVGYYTVPKATTNAVPYFAWLHHPQTQDKVMVTAILAQAATQNITCYTEFSTRFADGSVVNTQNSPVISCFKRPPEVLTIQLPGATDVGLLYRAHQRAMQEFAPDGIKILPPPGTELTYLREKTFVESNERQVKFGLMYLDRAGNCYRPTLYGAYYMAWQLLWPVKPIRMMLLRKRAAAFLRSLEMNPTI